MSFGLLNVIKTVRDHLESVSSLKNKIFYSKIDKSVEMPYAILNLNSSPTSQWSTELEQVTLVISIWGRTLVSAESVQSAVMSALDRWSFVVDGLESSGLLRSQCSFPTKNDDDSYSGVLVYRFFLN